MDPIKQQILLKTAKKVITAVIKGELFQKVVTGDPDLNAHCGCFVTLKNHERLRGCIGQFVSDKPLIHLVGDMAKASATSDPRFLSDPLRISELDDLHIEISVLSPLWKTEDPLSLRLGIDGIYIKKGRASGCFLPQVATETGWSKEEFLSYCCAHKAGLPAEAWKSRDTEVYLFTAEIFGALFADI